MFFSRYLGVIGEGIIMLQISKHLCTMDDSKFQRL